jgi:diguanylate cyclase (GGDEF)-like protein/putative nucleotidyltransferase with HDIG domain
MNLKSKIYVLAVSLTGFASVGWCLRHWDSQDWPRFVCYLVVSALAAGLKVNLPGVLGTMSVGFLFVFVGITELGLAETLILGCTGTLVQCIWRPKRRPALFQIVFSLASTGLAIIVAYSFYNSPWLHRFGRGSPLLLIVTGLIYFGANTAPIAGAISLSEGKRFSQTWHSCYFWSFPFYLLGTSVAWIMSLVSKQLDWQSSVMLLPVIYLIFRSYRLYLGRLEDQKRHAESMADLHLRTIEALALAIEAKDHKTHEHLQRVRTYAVELGKDLGMKDGDLEALRTAALLHDIGKLAVPEHIISKPGRLTPEEFEKMKIHPVVGAEILERVAFPYAVAPIVRAHHEKWDGTGYPYGLKGEEIPLGARILTAVDCLDALASDRQYRRALPLDQAMEQVEALSGRQFDPAVVSVLKRRYVELERMTQEQPPVDSAKLSTDIKIEKGAAPAAGFQCTKPVAGANENDFLTSIAAARQEVQLLFELVQELGNSLSLDETLSVVAVRLRKIVPYDATAIYVRDGGKLIPRYVNGDDFRFFSSLKIPMGEGLSGWVAENRKPIVNGNPAVEPGDQAGPSKPTTMRSALAVPLEGPSGVVGVMTLYRADSDAFSRDQLRILQAISSKVSVAIENALIFQTLEDSAAIDYLSELPNARSLFLRLDSDLARCKRNGEPLCVVVCDLDGFKQVNDHLGHLEGNRLLKTIAEMLRNQCREYDYVARMGGDEFVLLLPGSGHLLQQRIDEIRRIAVKTAIPNHNVSMSIGEACYPEDGSDAEDLLAAADKRMYAAKQARRRSNVVAFPVEAVGQDSGPVRLSATNAS